MKKRGQIAMEYMIVVGFSLLMIFPIIYIYGTEKEEIVEKVNKNQADEIIKEIIDSSEIIYYSGKPSTTTLKVYFPKRLENITINTNAITPYIHTNNGLLPGTSRETKINLSGKIDVKPGLFYIKIESIGDYVNISLK